MRLSDKTNSAPIPYRDSKLTRVLRPSLESNTKVILICNISPSSAAVDESVSTLNFAQRAKKVKQIVAKNNADPTKMIIIKYEQEINLLQHKLKELEQKNLPDLEPESLKIEIGVIKNRLSEEQAEKNRISEAFENAIMEKLQLEAEIAKLQSKILVSENLKVEVSEPMFGNNENLDRRILRLTISRETLPARKTFAKKAEETVPQKKVVERVERTSSIVAFNQDDFCKKTMDTPEEALKLQEILMELEKKGEISNNYSRRDTMLLDKIDNFNDLFEGFNLRNSVRNSFVNFNGFDEESLAENEPSIEELRQVVAEQDRIIEEMRKEGLEKSEKIELISDQLTLVKTNMETIQKRISSLKKAK